MDQESKLFIPLSIYASICFHNKAIKKIKLIGFGIYTVRVTNAALPVSLILKGQIMISLLFRQLICI